MASPVPPAAASDATALRRTFHAVGAYPAFRRLWLAALGASLGQWMQTTALGWLALDLTDRKAFVGLVAFMAGLPFLIVAVPGGVIIDRFDRRRVLMLCQGAAATLAVVVSVDVIAGWVQPWHLLIAAFCNGSLQALLNPSQQSLVPRLVPRESLTNAVGLMSAASSMTRVFGPSLAGAVIGFVGTGEAFLLQAAALVAAFGLIATTRHDGFGTAARAAPGVHGVLDGVRLMLSRDDLRGLLMLSVLPSFFIFPYLSFMAVFAKDVLAIGAQGLGLLMAVSGVGAVIGGLLVAGAGAQLGIGRRLIGCAGVYCLTITGFAASHWLWLSLPAIFGAGLIGSYFSSGGNALLQHLITDDVRGRVTGTYMLTWGLMPLGALPMGLLADRVGIQAAVAIGALVSLVGLGVLASRNPFFGFARLRWLEQPAGD